MPDTYNRAAAVSYAHKWAYARNPAYYDYEKIGGDCTNFVSQCLFAGSGVMNYSRSGWYYRNANDKSPSWTGVEFLHDFLTRTSGTRGPHGRDADISEAEPGDVIQLLFSGVRFSHSLLVVDTGSTPRTDNILVAAHSYDTDYKPVAAYSFQQLRLIHIGRG